MSLQDPGRTTGFPCKQCGAACPSLPGLLEHMDAHLREEEERKYKCDECGRGYRHAGSLANHKKTHQVGSFQCDTCGKEYCNALALKSHLRSHTSRKKHSCDECGKAFRLASQLGTHARVHLSRRVKEPADVEDAAREVESETETEYEYENDLSEPAAGLQVSAGNSPAGGGGDTEMAFGGAADRPFRCDLCDKSYIHSRSLTNHKKTHQVGMFECSVCFKQFSNMAALCSHQRTHRARSGTDSSGTPPGRFSPQRRGAPVNFCHLCQVLFPDDAEFQEHIQMHNSSSASFGLRDAAAENLDVSYDDDGVASPESNLYASPLNDVPSISSVDNLGGDRPAERIRSNGHVYSDRPDNQTPPFSGARGEPRVSDAGVLHPENSDDAADAEEADAVGDSAGRRFRCRICSKSYRHSGSLINHKRCHQVGIYQCSVCRKSYPHLAALKSHLRLHKNQASSFGEGDWLSSEPLTLDDQQGCSSSQEEEEEGEGEGETPPPPVLGLNQENGVERSASYREPFKPDVVHLPLGRPQRHMCADCGETFSDIAGIKRHSCPTLRQQHDAAASAGYRGDGRFPESVGYRAPGNPGSNVEFPGLNGGHEQSYFDQNFHDTLSLDQLNGDEEGGNHDEDDEDDDDDDDGDLCQCSICGNRYTSMRALRSHLRGHAQAHGTPGSSGPSSMSSHDEAKDDEPGEMTICSACGESFANRQDLIRHQLLHRKDREVDPVDVDGGGASAGREEAQAEEAQSVICGRCGIFCSSFQHLDDHGCADRTEDSASAKEETKGNGVAQHEEAPDAGDRRYGCDQCGRSYRHAGSLLNHKKSHKTGVFRCLVCQKRFYNLLALKNHQRSHFDIKRHTCPECGKAFKIQKQLLNHLRRHKENRAKIQDLNDQIQALMNEAQPAGGAQAPPPPAAQAPPPAAAHASPSSRRRRRGRLGAAVKSEAAGDQRPFACDQCGRTYRHAGSLVNHRNSHKTGDFSCSVCSNTYSNQLAMKNHLRTHFAYKKHCCQSCGKGFRGKKQLSGHRCARKEAARSARVLAARAARCRACRRAFVSAAQLAAHACDGGGAQAKAPSDREERPFACDVCGRSYRHAGSLLNHKNTHKTGSFSCSFCAKPFGNPMALRNHTRIHTQKKRYACLTCGKAFRLASILLNHQRVHERAAGRARCAACGKSFQGRSGLKRHRCRRGQENAPRAGVQQSERGDRCFMCDLCGRSYRHAGSLLNHKKTHPESLHHCSLCLQTFPDPLALQIHAMMRRHCCPECGKTFCQVAHLQSHMEVHSKDRRSAASCRRRASGTPPAPPPSARVPGGAESAAGGPEEKSHVCERCGRAYRHAGSLLNHKNSHKTGAFPCAACHKEFSNLMALKNHRRIHTEAKRYQCLQCGKAFRVATQLVCHRRSHSKERPYGCPPCGSSFSSKASLRHHQEVHHQEGHHQEGHHQEGHPQACASFSTEADAFMELDMGSFL